jgi:hypothetical protein
MPIFWVHMRNRDGATATPALGHSGQALLGPNVAWSFLVTTPIYQGR